MLCNPKVLSGIGKPEKETKDIPTIRNYYTDAKIMESAGDFAYGNFQMLLPNDITRQHFAAYLLEIAIDFIIAHELTHIVNGHLDFKVSRDSNFFFEERDFKVSKNLPLLTIQTLEMDADCMAVSNGIGNNVRRHLKQQEASDDFVEFYKDFNETIFNWSLSALTLLRIFAECRSFTDSEISMTHPHPRVRQLMVQSTIDAYLNKNFANLKQSLKEDNESAVTLEVEMTYKFITGNNIDKEEFLKAIDAGHKYTNQVLEHWQVIRPELTKYSYVNLAS